MKEKLPEGFPFVLKDDEEIKQIQSIWVVIKGEFLVIKKIER